MDGNGHLTIRELTGIVFTKIDELGVPEPSLIDLDHFSDCERCSEHGFELGEAIHDGIEHESHHQGVTTLDQFTLLAVCRRVVMEFETNEGGMDSDG